MPDFSQNAKPDYYDLHFACGRTDFTKVPDMPWPSKKQDDAVIKDRFSGCIIGGAVGDALGAPVEFMSRNEILNKFGAMGITSYAPAYGSIGTITDDTQMTMFTAEGLLRSWVRGNCRGLNIPSGLPMALEFAYQRWLATQDLGSLIENNGWLITHKKLFSRRAPGNTCLSALKKDSSKIPAPNDSKGCGGVMRVAPVGLFTWSLRDKISVTETFHLGAAAAAITHGHPSGYLAGGVLAVIIMALADGVSLQEALETAKNILQTQWQYEETMKAIEQAEKLAITDTEPFDAIAKLGQGWVAEEALAISVYCALKADTFTDAVIMAVNHDGDSDSTGAITGNIVGAMQGLKAIPEAFLEPLELKDVLLELASDLYAVPQWAKEIHSTNEWFSHPIRDKYPSG